MKNDKNTNRNDNQPIDEKDLHTHGATWREDVENKMWDEYLAWCIKQENTSHE